MYQRIVEMRRMNHNTFEKKEISQLLLRKIKFTCRSDILDRQIFLFGNATTRISRILSLFSRMMIEHRFREGNHEILRASNFLPDPILLISTIEKRSHDLAPVTEVKSSIIGESSANEARTHGKRSSTGTVYALRKQKSKPLALTCFLVKRSAKRAFLTKWLISRYSATSGT